MYNAPAGTNNNNRQNSRKSLAATGRTVSMSTGSPAKAELNVDPRRVSFAAGAAPQKGCLKSSLNSGTSSSQPVKKKSSFAAAVANKENRRVSFFDKTHVRAFTYSKKEELIATGEAEEEEDPTAFKIPVLSSEKRRSGSLFGIKFDEEDAGAETEAQKQGDQVQNTEPQASAYVEYVDQEISLEHESFEAPVNYNDGSENDGGSCNESSFRVAMVDDSDLSINQGDADSSMINDSFASPTPSEIAVFHQTFDNMLQGTPLAKFSSPSGNVFMKRDEATDNVDADMELTETVSPSVRNTRRKSSVAPVDMELTSTFSPIAPTAAKGSVKKSNRRGTVVDVVPMDLTDTVSPQTRRQSTRRKSSVAPVDMELTETLLQNSSPKSEKVETVENDQVKVEEPVEEVVVEEDKPASPVRSSPRLRNRKSSVGPVDMELVDESELNSSPAEEPVAPSVRSSPRLKSRKSSVAPADMDLTFTTENLEVDPDQSIEEEQQEEVSPTPASKKSASAVSTPAVKHKHKPVTPSKLSMVTMINFSSEDDPMRPISRSARVTPEKPVVETSDYVQSAGKGPQVRRKSTVATSPLVSSSKKNSNSGQKMLKKTMKKNDPSPRRLTMSPKDLKATKNVTPVKQQPVAENDLLVNEEMTLMASPSLPAKKVSKISPEDLYNFAQIEDACDYNENVYSELFLPSLIDPTNAYEIESYDKAISEWQYLVSRETNMLNSLESQIRINHELLQETIDHFADQEEDEHDSFPPAGFKQMLQVARAEAELDSLCEIVELKKQMVRPYMEYTFLKLQQVQQNCDDWERLLQQYCDSTSEPLRQEYERVNAIHQHAQERAKEFAYGNPTMENQLNQREQELKDAQSKISATEDELTELESKLQDLQLCKNEIESMKLRSLEDMEKYKEELEEILQQQQQQQQQQDEGFGSFDAKNTSSVAVGVRKLYELQTKCSYWELIEATEDSLRLVYKRLFEVVVEKSSKSVKRVMALKQLKLMEPFVECLNQWLNGLTTVQDAWYKIDTVIEIMMNYFELYKHQPNCRVSISDENELKVEFYDSNTKKMQQKIYTKSSSSSSSSSCNNNKNK
ncbi:hypothetical protein MP638_000093 [Amoeboaphelidium occidentale]|nr:hypothetical protein MP638_000093 [Amoeboaphelidium occidentale]